MSWYKPQIKLPPEDQLVLCKMVSTGAIVSGFIYEENNKFKVATPSNFHFEDYNDYECECWTYIP